MSLHRWSLCALFLVACSGGGKSTKTPPPDPGAGVDAAPAVEEPDMPIDAAEAVLDVSHLDPSEGKPGSTVTIHGTAFGSGSREVHVYFGAKEGAIGEVTETTITVQVPKLSAGDTVDVTVVFDPGGEVKISDGFSVPEND